MPRVDDQDNYRDAPHPGGDAGSTSSGELTEGPGSGPLPTHPGGGFSVIREKPRNPPATMGKWGETGGHKGEDGAWRDRFQNDDY